ncbi:MAG: MYXO-CTERM sorting domain-containing protein [Sandaracinaceae bacterium]
MTSLRLAAVLGIGSFLLAPALASAQAAGAQCPPDAVGCHTQDVDFTHRAAAFDDIMLDTGWVPSSGPLQVRFYVYIGGSTQVDLGGTAVTSWPSALDVAIPGRPGTGRFAINYGIEVVARIRFDVTVASIHYTWEGDIPVPASVPTDLRLADELVFDPFVLPPSDPRPVTVSDATDPIYIVNVPLTDALIPIPGISGNFAVTATGMLDAAYRTDTIDVTGSTGPIDMEGGSTLIRPASGTDFGAAQDYTVLPHGTIDYDGVITLAPGFFISIAGRRFDFSLIEIPIRVVDVTSNTEFNQEMVHVPLPDVRVDMRVLGVGEVAVGDMREVLVTVYNDGEAELELAVGDPGAPFSVLPAPMSVPPSSSVRLAVRYAPSEVGHDARRLSLATNDPDEPLVTIDLEGDAIMGLRDGGVPTDAGPGAEIEAGCACRATPGSRPSSLGLASIVLVALARRRRRAR